jgi:hypothetical protein
MGPGFPALVLLVVLAGLVAAPLSAQWPNASSPSDIQWIAQARGGPTTFRMGEVIPLDLSFTRTSPGGLRIRDRNLRPEWQARNIKKVPLRG